MWLLKHWSVRCVFLSFAAVIVASCNARFVDIRESRVMLPDGGNIDNSEACTATDPVVVAGTFIGNSDNQYDVAGNVTLSQNEDGTMTVDLSSDFATQQAAGVYLILTKRDSLIGDDGRPGVDEAAGDVSVSILESVIGPQSFGISGCSEAFTHAWILCKPFGIVFGEAELSLEAN